MAFSDALASAVFEQMPDAAIVVDGEGRIVAVNARACAMFASEAEELIANPIEVLIPSRYHETHAELRRGYVAEPRARPMGLGLDLWAQRIDGASFPVEISLSPTVIDEQHYVIAVVRDVSARLTLEAERQRTADLELLIEERERIAAELHDSVIQQLFAAALSLQAFAADRSIRGVERVDRAVDQIDNAIREIRTTVFGIVSPRSTRNLETEVAVVCEQAARILGFAPSVTVSLDGVDAISERLEIEVISTMREALSNVARHAAASHVWVRLTVDRAVEIAVDDDGVGFDSAAKSGFGLSNLARRAERLRGEFHVGPRAEGGTSLLWKVPISERDRG